MRTVRGDARVASSQAVTLAPLMLASHDVIVADLAALHSAQGRWPVLNFIR